MHIEQFEYVIEIAKRGNISKAADKLHVSHSAVSQAISNLESELGIPIFIRSRSGTTFTDKGEAVLKLSNEILNKIKELKELGHHSKDIPGSLAISASAIFFSTFLPETLKTFKLEYPHIQIEIDSNTLDPVIEKVKSFQTDIGLILGTDEILKEVSHFANARIIYSIKLMVAVSKNSPLAKMDVITPKELLKYPLVIRNERPPRKTWDKIFSLYGQGNVLFYTNNDEVMKNVIANDLAICFFTDLMKKDPLVLRGDISLIPYFDPIEMPNYHLICIQAKNKYSSIVEKDFILHLMKSLESYKAEIQDL
ncbi:LysR family transcriptional regulator [Peribacillus sp. NPDC094092]|uniref:LysR family transcriptional regulator n=1 Tax=Peribacillus sp. NPDC094092 TaxID=3390611 RepID=UPI003D035FCC